MQNTHICILLPRWCIPAGDSTIILQPSGCVIASNSHPRVSNPAGSTLEPAMVSICTDPVRMTRIITVSVPKSHGLKPIIPPAVIATTAAAVLVGIDHATAVTSGVKVTSCWTQQRCPSSWPAPQFMQTATMQPR